MVETRCLYVRIRRTGSRVPPNDGDGFAAVRSRSAFPKNFDAGIYRPSQDDILTPFLSQLHAKLAIPIACSNQVSDETWLG